MNTSTNTAEKLEDVELVITREIEAPRELVFKSWTEAERLTNWWAPKDCSTPYVKVDLRKGGSFHYCMLTPDGTGVWGKGVYREVVPYSLLVYVDSFSDKDGATVSPLRYGISAAHPLESTVIVTFTSYKDKTMLTLRHALDESVPEREQTRQGWGQMLDRLADYLKEEMMAGGEK